jgi:hypothetical protein
MRQSDNEVIKDILEPAAIPSLYGVPHTSYSIGLDTGRLGKWPLLCEIRLIGGKGKIPAEMVSWEMTSYCVPYCCRKLRQCVGWAAFVLVRGILHEGRRVEYLYFV